MGIAIYVYPQDFFQYSKLYLGGIKDNLAIFSVFKIVKISKGHLDFKMQKRPESQKEVLRYSYR